MQDRSDLLVRLTRAVGATPPGAPLTLRLCAAMVEILQRQGGAVTVGSTAPTRATLCATDDFADRLEDLQDVLGEGPGLDAHRLRQAISATPEELPSRWPMLAQAMSEQLPPAHLLAVPMRPEDEVLGVITLYGHEPMPTGYDNAETQFLADAIGVAILGGVSRAETPEQLWSTRDRVDQATGMVVAQLRIEPGDALAVLRAHAFAHNTSLAAIADQVLGRKLDFQAGHDSGSESRGDA